MGSTANPPQKAEESALMDLLQGITIFNITAAFTIIPHFWHFLTALMLLKVQHLAFTEEPLLSALLLQESHINGQVSVLHKYSH